jgi:hypothetical protein
LIFVTFHDLPGSPTVAVSRRLPADILLLALHAVSCALSRWIWKQIWMEMAWDYGLQDE